MNEVGLLFNSLLNRNLYVLLLYGEIEGINCGSAVMGRID